jgi:serine carboxypeptidase
MGPAFARFFEDQNDLRRSGNLPSTILDIRLSALGIMNGFIDQAVQVPYYPKFAANNTYGVAAIDLTTMYNSISNLTAPGGCIDLLTTCRSLMDKADPNGYGDVSAVNNACEAAQTSCNLIQNVYLPSGLSIYDIRQNHPSPFPSSAYREYLNNPMVQRSIGVPLNYTDSSSAVFNDFITTGDVNRDDPLFDLSYLLSKNIRISLIYGDADYICNWVGGAAIANALASNNTGYAVPFSASGYAEIVVNKSYVGGAVKEYGNLSFVRVYDAGHQVPAYQPETAFTIFTRIILGTSVAMGEVVNLSTFSTTGPSESTKSNKAGSSSNPVCWIRSPNTTCSTQQISQILAGNGIVMNGIWYAKSSDFQPPASTVIAGKPGSTPSPVRGTNSNPSSSTPVTGVYTATATPTMKGSASTQQFSKVTLFCCVFAAFICLIPIL